jgi:hypothetical protein
MKTKRNRFIGRTLQYLTVLGYDAGEDHRGYFSCRCICGKVIRVRAENVIGKRTHSCGCMKSSLSMMANTLPNNLGLINKLYRQYEARAKKKKLEFSLTIEQFQTLIFSNCTYCGSSPRHVMLVSSSKRKKKPFSYNGVDIIDNNLGYYQSNCAPCCSQCNQAKSSYSVDEFKKWIVKVYTTMATSRVDYTAECIPRRIQVCRGHRRGNYDVGRRQ